MAENTINAGQFPTEDFLLTDFIVKTLADGTLEKDTVQNLANTIATVGEVGFKGKLLIADTPSVDGWWIAGESGTYTNAGGLVVSLTNQFVIIVRQTTFSKIDIPLNIIFDAVPTDGSINAVESNGVFDALALKANLTDTYNNPIPQEIGTTPATSASVTPASSYMIQQKNNESSVLKKVDLWCLSTGTAKIIVLSSNPDTTVNVVSSTSVTLSSTGALSLIDGVDFNSISVPENGYLILFTPSGQATIAFLSGDTNAPYYAMGSGEITGSNIALGTLTTNNNLNIKFTTETIATFKTVIEARVSDLETDVQANTTALSSLVTTTEQSIGVTTPASGSSAGINTYVNNFTSNVESKVKSISAFINTIGSAKIKVIKDNGDGTVSWISDTVINFASTGLQTLTDGVDFNNVLVPAGCYVSIYTPNIGARYSFKSGSTVPYFDLSGDFTGQNITKTTVTSSNELQIKVVLESLTLEGRIDENLTAINNLSDEVDALQFDEIYNFIESNISASGLVVDYTGTKLKGYETDINLSGTTTIPSTTTVTGETITNKTLEYNSTSNPTGAVLIVENSSGDNVKNISSVSVTKTSDGTPLVLDTDYRLFSSQGRLTGANASVTTIQVNVTFDYIKERVDLIQISNAGVVSVSSGIERFVDATDDAYIAKPTNGNYPLAYVVVRGTSLTVVDCSKWDKFYYQNKESELFRAVEFGKNNLPKTLKKLINGTAVKIAGYGDSIIQCGFSNGVYTANGVNRDNIAYYTVEDYPTTNITLYDFSDGGGNVHQKTSYIWHLISYLEKKYSSVISYDNFGIGGTTSTGGLIQARIDEVIASNADLCVIGFGMNELGSGSTYANMVDIIEQLQAVGTECLVLGVPKINGESNLSVTSWRNTNNQLKQSAIATNSTYLPTSYFAETQRLGYFGMDDNAMCGANLYNHPSPRELRLIGEILTLLF